LTYLERQKSYGPDKLRWEEAEEEEEEAEEKIRLKQYVSLRSKGRHNYYSEICLNWTYLGPGFVFGVDRCSVYQGLNKKNVLHWDYLKISLFRIHF
jgi:hypothetical protein